jgi:FkbM family methyltransferase
MHYKYVDIGTSDFDTCLDFVNSNNIENILLVEPIFYYLNKLPTYPNVIKDNVAISNTTGKLKVYFLPEDIISNYNFPQWLRGCNTINTRHPTVDRHLTDNNISLDLVESTDVDVITFDMLCQKHNIESIDSLKIDTEGHEEFILPDVLGKVKQGFLINNIKFENQSYLGNKPFLNNLRNEFIKNGYRLVEQTDQDVVLSKTLT